MEIYDFLDMSKLQEIQDNFSDATGLATIAVDSKGEYMTEPSNFTDFCMKYTRGSAEGNRRCVKNDNECTGTYACHAGLMDFSFDIIVNGEKLGAMIGGQVFTKEPDEANIRSLAEELGIDPDAYVRAVRKVPVMDEKKVRASSKLLELIVNQLVEMEYNQYKNSGRLTGLSDEINHATEVIETINNNTHSLKSIASKQKMLSLNASIEAARSGEAGVGFAVVAKSMGDLSTQSAAIYGDIEKSVIEVTDAIEKLAGMYHQ